MRLACLGSRLDDLEIPMMTQGPDLNLSWSGATAAECIDAGKKMTYYSPYIIPFTSSSPFVNGGLWGGQSYRTFRQHFA